ncbi:MAG: CidA/LrgA family protein [Lachnospiraceae bacterium]|nr:CidA/LrgA family protein [Lachnospiraceae bacterium]
MKYMMQFLIIMSVTFAGELLKYFIPLPIPASIYGLVIMLILLCTKIVKIDRVKEAGGFLVEIMPLMFIPSAAGLLVSWHLIKDNLIPIIFATIISTFIVMVVTGKVTDFIITLGGKKDE